MPVKEGKGFVLYMNFQEYNIRKIMFVKDKETNAKNVAEKNTHP